MGITSSLRKVLDRKEWEMMTPSPATNVAGAFTITDPTGEDKSIVLVNGASAIYRYDSFQDGWQLLPNSGIAGTFGVGSCGTFQNIGASGTATNGTTTTISTGLTLNRSIKGYVVRIKSGANAGLDRVILSNTLGANSVITVDSAYPIAITNASTYTLLTGKYWFFNAGTTAVGFSYYDRALNTWTAKSVTGLPTAWGTDARLCATTSAYGTSFASGTATSATTTTLVNSAKSWTASQWVNYQIRITGGTGVGQVRTITASNATSVTVATWTITPDATSTYVIEGNEDYLYLMGSNAVTLYRYSISANTWTTIIPTVARGGAFATGGSGNWCPSCKDESFANENTIINGRRIYSFRGGASSILDYYDIPSNSWVALTYTPSADTFGAGSCYDYDDDYILIQKENTGRIFRYIIAENKLMPWSTLIYPNGTVTAGDKMFTKALTDGGTTLKWVYTLGHSNALLFRCLMIDN